MRSVRFNGSQWQENVLVQINWWILTPRFLLSLFSHTALHSVPQMNKKGFFHLSQETIVRSSYTDNSIWCLLLCGNVVNKVISLRRHQRSDDLKRSPSNQSLEQTYLHSEGQPVTEHPLPVPVRWDDTIVRVTSLIEGLFGFKGFMGPNWIL